MTRKGNFASVYLSARYLTSSLAVLRGERRDSRPSLSIDRSEVLMRRDEVEELWKGVIGVLLVEESCFVPGSTRERDVCGCW